MKNLFSYLKVYSDVSFAELPFNDVDALVLIELSYLNLEGVMNENDEYSFRDVISLENKKTLLKDTFVPRLDSKLITALAKAERFKELKFSNALLRELPENMMQYFSVKLSDSGKRNYFLFRGTNKTVFGSLEDLLFSLKKGPDSVGIATDYLSRLLKDDGSENYIIGHSKGGTIGECSYLRLSEENKKKITRIYNFDGPGMTDIPEGEYLTDLSSKTRKFITKRTMFGLLLKNPHDYTVADGKGYWLLHHMVFSWRIDGVSIAVAPSISKASFRKAKRMNDFVFKIGEEGAGRIISSCKYLMTESGLFRINDLTLMRIIKFLIIYHKARKKKLLSPDFKEFLLVCKDVFL